jgi:hypothetical protein
LTARKNEVLILSQDLEIYFASSITYGDSSYV